MSTCGQNKDCKFCIKKGLLWLPLRYCTVSSEDPSALDALPKIGGKLGVGVTDIALTKSKYAVRLLRPGYLYVLIERNGIKSWDAYQVLEDAYLYKFVPEYPPQITPEFSCNPESGGLNASMVAIPNAAEVKRMWAIFTPSPLTKAKLDLYKADPKKYEADPKAKSSADAKAKTDKYDSEGILQPFSPADWSTEADTAQPHTLLAPELLTTVAEYILLAYQSNAKISPLGKALEIHQFPVTEHAHRGTIPNEKGEYGGRLGKLQALIKKNGYASLALYDHIGITQELNDFRNDAFKPIDDFMGKRDSDGIDNRWRFDVHNAIGQWRVLYDKGLVAEGAHHIEINDIQRRSYVEPIFPDDPLALRVQKSTVQTARGRYVGHPSRAQWEADNPKIVEKLEDARDLEEECLEERAPAEAIKLWKDKFAPQLDEVEMSNFNKSMNALSKRAHEKGNDRVIQHMAWLKSPRLLNAFDIYDHHSAPSGEALRGHVVGCIFGMEGSTEAEDILTEWATATSITRDNLFLRAFTRDQEGVKKEANKTLAEVTSHAKGMDADSFLPATSWQKAIKGLVAATKSTDSALDEWMRFYAQSKNFGKDKSYLNPNHIANVEARFFYMISVMTRAVARKGIGSKADTAVVFRINALMHSLLGDLAAEVQQETLKSVADPTKWNDLKKRITDQDKLIKETAARKTSRDKKIYRKAQHTKASLQWAAIDLLKDAQLKAKLEIAKGAKKFGWTSIQTQLEESAKQHRNYQVEFEALEQRAKDALKNGTMPSTQVPSTPSPTNNLHQVRIGGALGGLEAIGLVTKLTHCKSFGEIFSAEITASFCSLGSIMFDMLYAHTKSVRELPQYAIVKGVNQSLDIGRGGFKITAGLLGGIAGFITAGLDWQAKEKEKDPIQRAILGFRFWSGVGSSSASLLASYSYSGPLFERIAEKEGRSWLAARGSGLAARGAFAISKRVWLLRTLAWAGWVGVVITIVDLSYAGYRMYMDATAVQRWLSHCVFRDNKSNKAFSGAIEELKAFEKAQNPDMPEEEKPVSNEELSVAAFPGVMVAF